jgi:hypothetical protein
VLPWRANGAHNRGYRCSRPPRLQAVNRINRWYEENNIFGCVDINPEVIARSMTTGNIEIKVNELETGNVGLRFVDDKGAETKARSREECCACDAA